VGYIICIKLIDFDTHENNIYWISFYHLAIYPVFVKFTQDYVQVHMCICVHTYTYIDTEDGWCE
jgi:hypothetical protein